MEPLEGLLGQVLPTFPGGFLALLFGRKGIGKTSLALTAFKRPDIYVNEMTPDLYASYSKRLGVGWRVCHHIGAEEGTMEGTVRRTWRRVDDPPELPLELRCADIVVDSISNAPRPLAILRQLREHCRTTGSRAIAIAHTTKSGELAGREAAAHLVDTMIELDQVEGHRRIFGHKHRGGPHHLVVFVLGAKGPAVPKWDRYYSIEGKGPGYRVSPYPARNARYARRLAVAAKDGAEDLPAPPVAVSMEDLGKLGGWAEPSDGVDRRDFALGIGLPYFDASGELHKP